MKAPAVLFMLLLTAVKAVSQDMPVMDWIGPVVQYHRAGELYQANLNKANAKAGSAALNKTRGKQTADTPTGKTLIETFTYQITPARQQAIINAYVSRIATHNQPSASQLAVQLAKVNYSRIYAGIIAPFGYQEFDAADAFAAYTLLGWMIANQAPNPTPAQAAAVRRQLARTLGTKTQFTTSQGRAAFGEELKVVFVTLHAGWQSARKEGSLASFSDMVAARFARSGTDLRRVNLTNTGLSKQ